MLNEESRKYFNRVYIGSGSALNDRTFSQENHIERMQNFTKIVNVHKMIEYLKTASSESLDDCGEMNSFGRTLNLSWSPTIENRNRTGAFITQTPKDLYNSGEIPSIDALFSFTSQVSKMLKKSLSIVFF